MTYDSIHALRNAEKRNNKRKARKQKRSLSVEHAENIKRKAEYALGNKICKEYKPGISSEPMLNGDVRSGFNAVNSEWWRGSARVPAPGNIKDMYRKR